VGPQLMAHSGRLRPYANAFAGVSYFATTSQLVFPRPVPAFVVPGVPIVPTQDPFRTTTHYDDVIASYGGGAGVLVGLGQGGTALDLGLRYVGGGTVRYLVEGDRRTPFKGGALVGNVIEALANARWSAEAGFYGDYHGPQTARFGSLAIAGGEG